MKEILPFTAIVDQDDFKLCLILCLIDPTLGGVLVSGDKGTGKTTTVRSLARLMGDQDVTPFLNLPLGATEDRVLGSLKLDVLINDKRLEVEKGLLAQANKGILYIDEVNLLDDHLMDALLDAAASGGYHLERDGISEWLESRFALVGTMNPEEGELRPQLLDRFGLSVAVETPQDLGTRKQIAKIRMAFDTNPHLVIEEYSGRQELLKAQIHKAQQQLNQIAVYEEIYDLASERCLQAGVEGMRADILLVKAARSYAAFHDKQAVLKEDIDVVAPFVLRHRSKTARQQQQPNEEPQPDSHTV